MIVIDGIFTGITGGVAVAALVVVFVVCLRVLPEMGFTGASQKVLAFCVAALSAIGIVAFGPGGASSVPATEETETILFMLLPYAALGLTLLLLPLIVLLDRWYKRLRQTTERFKEWKRPERKRGSQMLEKRAPEEYRQWAQRRRLR